MFSRSLVVRLAIAVTLASLTLNLATECRAQEKTFEQQQEKLQAFAKTFGYIRYFHPSDQATLVNWDSMAIFGAQAVLQSDDGETTEALLQKIFGPLVVDLELYHGEQKPDPETTDVPIDKIIAWQHVGVGVSEKGSLYRSGRSNRTKMATTKADKFATLIQSFPATELRGKQIRFRFRAKSVDASCRLQGWLRVDRESGEQGFFDNMQDRPIQKTEWDEYEIIGTVDDDAKLLTIGVMLLSDGAGLIDQVTLEQKDGDEWKSIEIKNANFEDDDEKLTGWNGNGKGFSFDLEKEDVAEGETALRISKDEGKKGRNVLKIVPRLGEVIDANLVSDLRVRMPLTLPIEHSYKRGDIPSVDEFLNQVNSTETGEVEQDVLCVANVVISWNLFQHFYPYFEQVETDWQNVLETSLQSAVKCVRVQETTETLQWLVAQLHDGHGRVMHQTMFQQMKHVPLNFVWAENELIVSESEVDEIQIGDIVTKIGDTPAGEYLKKKEELISGSPQWKRYRSLGEVTVGKSESSLELTIKRDDEIKSVVTTFSADRPLKVHLYDNVELIEGTEGESDAIYYVDLGRAKPDDVRPMMKEFAEARGIIFDMRGYPNGTQFLFQHMSDQHLQSAKWQVPRQIHPDRVDMKEIETMGRWEMPPMKPRFQGKFVFITNGSAISYAESCMAIIANYKLAEIVGSPTAGANGNINPFALPGGYRVSWTGMRVMNHDDSQHHVLGVQPTIPLQPTIQGVKDDIDELFEKALDVVKSSSEEH